MRKRLAPRATGRVGETFSSSGYWTGAHTTHRLRFHLVWIPKYRRRVLEEPVAARLRELLHQACEVNRWGLHELNVQLDHVHLLVQVPPTDCVSDVMNVLKGSTAYALRRAFPELTEYLWGESFWADGYFAETVGQTEEAVVRTYIRNQNSTQNHQNSTQNQSPSRQAKQRRLDDPRTFCKEQELCLYKSC